MANHNPDEIIGLPCPLCKEGHIIKGKTAYADGKPVLAVKKANDIRPEEKACTVDAITGATLTSDGVNLMLQSCLADYQDYLSAE